MVAVVGGVGVRVRASRLREGARSEFRVGDIGARPEFYGRTWGAKTAGLMTSTWHRVLDRQPAGLRGSSASQRGWTENHLLLTLDPAVDSSDAGAVVVALPLHPGTLPRRRPTSHEPAVVQMLKEHMDKKVQCRPHPDRGVHTG